MTRLNAHDERVRDRVVEFGLSLRSHRIRAGLSQEALAEKAGCDRQSIHRWESAAYSASLPSLFLLADALGVSVGELVEPPGGEA